MSAEAGEYATRRVAGLLEDDDDDDSVRKGWSGNPIRGVGSVRPRWCKVKQR